MLEEKPDTRSEEKEIKKEVAQESEPSGSNVNDVVEIGGNEESEDSKPSTSKDSDDQWEPALVSAL